MASDHIYDVAILGGGSAGCVLAARLSELSDLSVLLIEAGRDLLAGQVPADIASPYPARPQFKADNIWPDLRVAMGRDGSNTQAATVRFYEQARILGGGSSINGIGANRGSPDDYAEWVEAGAQSWSWDEVLPYFRKLETDLDLHGDKTLHGDAGPLPIQRIRPDAFSGFINDLLGSFREAGFAQRADQNGQWETGVFPTAVNLDRAGQRASVATAYLHSAVRARRNLEIRTKTQVDTLVIADGRVTGANLVSEGRPQRIRARLIVVATGALQTPALLQRSGVGPGDVLSAAGVEVQVERRGVGRNLLEHPSIGVSAFLKPRARLGQPEQYHIQSVLRWSSGLDGTPAGDMHTAMSARSGWHAVGARIGTLFSWVNKSYSHGQVSIASPDASRPPEVDFRLLSDERDLNRLAQAFSFCAKTLGSTRMADSVLDAFPTTYSDSVKKLLKIGWRNGLLTSLAAPAMDRSVFLRQRVLALAQDGTTSLSELTSNPDLLRKHLAKHAGGVWHPCGTCRMGKADDAMAVTDPRGKVMGVEGLYVCDASLMPTIPCANLNVPVIMMAEKVSDGLKAVIGRRTV